MGRLFRFTLPRVITFVAIFIYFIICHSLGMLLNACPRIRPLYNVTVNSTECQLKTFLTPVPRYFCVEYCDWLPGCLGVTMEMGNHGNMTSWCCAFKMRKLRIAAGEHVLLHSTGVEVIQQDSETGTEVCERTILQICL